MYCDGIGEIEREVADVYDKQGNMSAVAFMSQIPGHTIRKKILDGYQLKRLREIRADQFKEEWESATRGLSR